MGSFSTAHSRTDEEYDQKLNANKPSRKRNINKINNNYSVEIR